MTDAADRDHRPGPAAPGPGRAAGPGDRPADHRARPAIRSRAVRVIDLLARLERGRPIRLADIVDRLNATYLDWLFPLPVVADVALQLQANWMADYRNSSGIVVEDGPSGRR